MSDRRIGKFKVSGDFIRSACSGEGQNLLRGMVVLEIEHDFIGDIAVYTAWHPDFAVIQSGQIIPEYCALFYSTSATPYWERIKT